MLTEDRSRVALIRARGQIRCGEVRAAGGGVVSAVPLLLAANCSEGFCSSPLRLQKPMCQLAPHGDVIRET